MANIPIPDYTALAEKTQQSNQSAMNQQTQANRPNQMNQGGSLTWTQDPTTGQWTQTQAMNPALTGSADAQQQTQLGLSQGAQGLAQGAVDAAGKPLDTSGMTQVNQYDPNKYLSTMDSGFGGVKEVTDAMMGRLQPGMDQARSALIQRLRSQGISQDSGAYQRAINTQDQSDVDARQRALLAGTSEYNTEFNRNLAQNQQNSGIGMNAFSTSTNDRQRMMDEAMLQRGLPLSDLKGLMGAAGGVTAPNFAGFGSAGNSGGVDYYGAGKDIFNNQISEKNAQTASDAAHRSGNYDLLKSVGGGLFDAYGSDIGGWLKGLFGG